MVSSSVQPQPFANKVVALTGAASGIGLATAHLLASRGAKLSLADLQAEALEKVKADIEAKYPGAQVLTAAVDVRKPEAVEAWTQETVKHFGRLDGAANLAGVIPKSIGLVRVSEQPLDEWDFVMGVNLNGVMYCMKSQLAVMADGGSVVNASSIAGLQGRENNAAYSASKHGVVGLTRSAAKEFGRKAIRVNAICPGPIDTPMARSSQDIAANAGDAKHTAKLVDEVALKRSGTAEEVAFLIGFLLSDESTYITGNAISIDGGWNC